MEVALEFEEKDKELKMLRKQTKIDRLVMTNNRSIILIALMATFLLFALVFIFIFYSKIIKSPSTDNFITTWYIGTCWNPCS